MKILCVIPAKGYSKRLPNKNLKLWKKPGDYHSKPLIAHTIEQAKLCKYPMDLVVATDSKLIENICREWGCNYIRLDPFVTVEGMHVPDAVKWVYHNSPGYDLILTLQPTSPLRTSFDIGSALDLAILTGAECVESRTNGKQNGAIYIYRGDTLYMFGKEINGKNIAQTEVYQMDEGLDIDDEKDWDELEARR